ncbi:MAG: HAMP domain-containing protein, partial [Bacteroidales bacterium]
MQTQTSIYHKLILYIFLLGIFVIVAVSLFSFITARNAILDRTFEQLTSLRVAKKGQVEQFFKDRIKEVELFAHQDNTGVFQFSTKHLNGSLSFNLVKEGMDSSFEKFFKSGNYFEKVYIIRGGHIERYAFDTANSKKLDVTTEEKDQLNTVISKVTTDKQIVVQDYTSRASDSTTHLFIASPLYGSQFSSANLVVFELKESAINTIMKGDEVANGLGKSGEVYLVGPDLLMRSESRFYEKSIMRLPIKTRTVENAYKYIEGTQVSNDYRGIPTLSSYSRLLLPGLDWVIIAEIDRKEAMKPVYKLANEIVFLSIFITLILFIVAYIISQTIARPIIELKNATIKVQKGDLDSVLHIKSNDELGELTENFNLMTAQLKAQQSEIKEREARMFSSFIDGQEDERQRLSRELHDGLGQLIIATKLKTETMVNAGSGINSESIVRLRSMFDSLVDEVRGISNNLMPPVLQEFGLEIALSHICNEIARHSQIKVIFDSQMPKGELDMRIATYTFRIAQEALNNAVKHAGASEIIMTLIGNEKMINLMVQDDGVGINLADPCNQNGRGLNSMCERV